MSEIQKKKPAPKFQHPFIEGLQNPPTNRKKELQKVRSWMNSQPHLPHISDDYIYLFLHAAYYNVDKTKQSIENYFTVRANSPALFDDRDPYSPRMEVTKGLAHLVRLPKTTPEGYKVLLYTLRDPDPTKLVFSDAVKGFCMYNDCVLSEDGLVEGYVVVFDMKGISIGHLARVSLPPLRAFMFYIQEAHPARLRAIHVLNTASWVHHIMRIVLPLVRSDMLGLVKFHKGNIPEGIPLEMLPEEYGGEAPCIEELDVRTKMMADKYADWLIESSYFQADESKRVKKTTWWGLLTGTNNADNKLDEKTILQNLQVD